MSRLNDPDNQSRRRIALRTARAHATVRAQHTWMGNETSAAIRLARLRQAARDLCYAPLDGPIGEALAAEPQPAQVVAAQARAIVARCLDILTRGERPSPQETAWR